MQLKLISNLIYQYYRKLKMQWLALASKSYNIIIVLTLTINRMKLKKKNLFTFIIWLSFFPWIFVVNLSSNTGMRILLAMSSIINDLLRLRVIKCMEIGLKLANTTRILLAVPSRISFNHSIRKIINSMSAIGFNFCGKAVPSSFDAKGGEILPLCLTLF